MTLAELPAAPACATCGKIAHGSLPGRSELLCATCLIRHPDFGKGQASPRPEGWHLCEGCECSAARPGDLHICFCELQENLCDSCRAACEAFSQ